MMQSKSANSSPKNGEKKGKLSARKLHAALAKGKSSSPKVIQRKRPASGRPQLSQRGSEEKLRTT